MTFFFLCCLTQLCTASPSGGRQPVTYLSGKIPPLPFSRGLLRGGLGGDVSSSGALRSGHDGSTEVDVGEDEEDIYGLSHFWYNMVHYAQSLVSETNFTLSSELTEVNSKVINNTFMFTCMNDFMVAFHVTIQGEGALISIVTGRAL